MTKRKGKKMSASTICTVTLLSGEVIQRAIRQYNNSYYVIYQGGQIPVKRDKVIDGRQTYKQFDRMYETYTQNKEKWTYEINDVLLIKRKDQEIVARVVGHVDQMDNTEPLYCNLRIADGKAWGQRRVTVLANDIIKPLPNWQKERDAEFETSIKDVADHAYAKMTQVQKEKLRHDTERKQRRTALDIMIDRACGVE